MPEKRAGCVLSSAMHASLFVLYRLIVLPDAYAV